LFSSPEQATSEKYDYRTDIFSLAMTIILLFCSFSTVHEQRSIIEIIRQRKLETIQMPSRLKSVMYRCLGSESERPAMSEIQAVLRSLLREIHQMKQKGNMPLGDRKQNISLDSSAQFALTNHPKSH
jgi:serine/threonine protein kinase